ncbi:MAG: class II fructose-1,6-bisphosphate aldolase [Acholeplasmataceae bacterium]|nr:class II fructose-1,6-bisphosphate aldolase [Acholeplasmataceae bacterium]
MALVSAKEMLNKARKEGYAVAQININNLEWTQSALKAAQELNSPIILGVSEGAARYMGGYRTVVCMVKELMKHYNITIPVALHLDHGSYKGAFEALEAGFSSIMFDGSHYPIEENVAKTREVVEKAHAMGVSVEAEVGGIGGEEDGVVSSGELADVEECKMVASLGVDLFAAGIGNIHGKYPDNWAGLNFELLAEISEAVGRIPLVLHGGTGIPEEQVLKSISLGVAKINVNTECQLAFASAVREYILAGKDLEGKGYDPRRLLKPGAEAIIEVVKEKLTMFGSINKA